ncbi:hypothetical protein P9112_009941 [Eukaryota sp. TZLM1-RC]
MSVTPLMLLFLLTIVYFLVLSLVFLVLNCCLEQSSPSHTLSISVDRRHLSFSTPSSFRSIFSNICALSFPEFFPSLGLELVTLLIFFGVGEIRTQDLSLVQF